MGLSNELISQFAKLTVNNKKNSTETTVYGEIVTDGNGNKYARIDGSDQLTPITSTTDIDSGDRVTVMVKDHTATVTGNLSSPSAKNEKVEALGKKISEFEIVIADKVSAKELDVEKGRIDDLVSENVTITNQLNAAYVEIGKLVVKDSEITGKLTADEAEIDKLKTDKLDASVADVKFATIENLEATNADIRNLEADYIEVEQLVGNKLNVNFGNIDYANIDKATFDEFYAQSGLIEQVTASDMTVTGYLVGVTIKGDLIEGGTIVADKLLIKGEQGLYYQLNATGETITTEQTAYNSLDGSIITAKSIAANKIHAEDLEAFGATIGGFKIKTHSLHSHLKETVDNASTGIYLDDEGQIAIGDGNNFVKYYKTTDANGDEVYKLEISAESILFGDGSKTSASDLQALTEHVKIGTYEDPDTGDSKPCVELAEGDSDFKQRITNTKTEFLDGATVRTTIDTDGITTENMSISNEFRHCGFVWAGRPNGNYGLIWKG